MKPKYRPDIDGLRAVAVLAVLFYHLGIGPFGGGYVGVDVFFVISGYLITSIILREIGQASFSLAGFYVRRCRRILPALIAVIAFTVVAGFLLLHPGRLEDLGKAVIATALFSSNFLFSATAGYFDGPAEMRPLLHTWSLAIEEQYYIFYPILLFIIAKGAGKKYANWLFGISALSLLLCIFGTMQNATLSFYLLPTRAWELFIGGILATGAVPVVRDQRLREGLAMGGLASIGIAVFGFSATTPFPGYLALLPTLGTAAVIHAGIGGSSWAAKVLSLRAVVFVGLISYSLYLWHWPLLVYAKRYSITELTGLQTAAILVLSLVLATLSWRFVERPFRTKHDKGGQAKVLWTSAAALALTVGLGWAVVANKGFPERFSMVENYKPGGPDREWAHWGTCDRASRRAKELAKLCDIGIPQKQPTFLFWGDSHARSLASGLDLTARSAGVAGKIATRPGCPPLLSIDREDRRTCHKFNRRVLSMIESSAEIDTVILAARWALAVNGSRYKSEHGEPISLLDLENPGMEGDNEAVFRTGVQRTVDALEKLGRKVVLVLPTPEVGYHVPSAHFIAAVTGRDVEKIIGPSIAEFKERSQGIEALFRDLQTSGRVSLVDPAAYLCDEEKCRVTLEGQSLYRDDDHLSTFGSEYVSAAFAAAFQPASGATQ